MASGWKRKPLRPMCYLHEVAQIPLFFKIQRLINFHLIDLLIYISQRWYKFIPLACEVFIGIRQLVIVCFQCKLVSLMYCNMEKILNARFTTILGKKTLSLCHKRKSYKWDRSKRYRSVNLFSRLSSFLLPKF